MTISQGATSLMCSFPSGKFPKVRYDPLRHLRLQWGPSTAREGVQRRHDPRKNDLRVSGFAELPPGPAKLVSQPQ